MGLLIVFLRVEVVGPGLGPDLGLGVALVVVIVEVLCSVNGSPALVLLSSRQWVPSFTVKVLVTLWTWVLGGSDSSKRGEQMRLRERWWA